MKLKKLAPVARVTWLSLLPLAVIACGDDKKGDGEAATVTTQPVEVCGGTITCGEPCADDSSCPPGQYCSDADTCYAECTPSMGCDGQCSADGRCMGTRAQVVVNPGAGASGSDELIVGEDDGASGGGTFTPAAGGAFENCATSSTSGEQTPVVMYLMFDRSSSMAMNNRWQDATAALLQFFEDPASADLGIAYAVFPSEANDCADPACSRDACAAPVVGLGTLSAQAAPDDGHEAALVNAVVNDQPGDGSGSTPTDIALGGSIDWATDYQASDPNSTAVVVLVTDGEPTGCNNDIGYISDIAAEGFANGVRTYAIGIEGSQEGQMNQIAAAGGTGEGIFIGGAANAGQALLDALTQIRGEVASCDMQMPRPDVGVVDPSKVNVQLTLSNGSVELGQVEGSDACGDLAAWYYNDNLTPTRILLCPATCDAVQRDMAPRLDIVLGCSTNLTPPSGVR